MHVRQQIRDQIVSLLTGLPTTQDRVFVDVDVPVSSDEVPCIIVRTPKDEFYEGLSTYSGDQTRDLTIEIEARAKGQNAVDVTDTICLEVETVFFNNDDLSIGLADLRYGGTDITISADTEKTVVTAILTINGHYRINKSNPGVMVA